MADFLEERAPHRSRKLAQCGTYLLFRDYFTVGEMKLAAGMFCQQHLLCPLCARLRSARVQRKYLERIQHVSKVTGAHASMLTLTVKNGDDLAERAAHLISSFGVLTKKAQRIRSGSRDKTEFSKFVGGVGSVEIKRGRGGKWHPHLHAIALHLERVEMEELRAEWHRITGDSFNVDLRNLDSVRTGSGDLESDLREVFKYAMKFADMSLEDNWQAFRDMRCKRLLRAWGALYGVKVPDDLSDENELAADLPFVERLLIYRRRKGEYENNSDAEVLKWFKGQLSNRKKREASHVSNS